MVNPRIKAVTMDSLALAVILVAVGILAGVLFGANGVRIATSMSIVVTACVGLQVFSGNTGIVSFGPAAFMGVGAYTAGILTMSPVVQRTALPHLPVWMAGYGLSVWSSLIVAALTGLVLAGVSGIVMRRLSGSAASIATLALQIIVYTVLVATKDITRGSQTFYGVPRNTTLVVALSVAALSIAVARTFRDTRTGRAVRATREDEVAAAAVGVDVRQARLRAWLLSGTILSIAGALTAQFLGAFGPKDFYFESCFLLISMLIVGGIGSVSGALVGVIVITAVTELLRALEGGGDILGFSVPALYGLPLVGASLAMILVLFIRPTGLVGSRELELSKAWDPLKGRDSKLLPGSQDFQAPKGAHALEANQLSRHFGGVRAVDGVTFKAEAGLITGLIGPNGAGKSTLINLLTGQLRPSAGHVALGSDLIENKQPHIIARAGLARTFQNLRVFADMTVRENVLVAAEACAADTALSVWRTNDALARFGLETLGDRLAGSLPYGQRRLVEIARALATGPRFLLLDEPAAGMNPAETKELMGRLAALRADTGVGILVVEHDLHLIMSLSDTIVVIDRGKRIAVGTADAVRTDPAVISAYLGSKRMGEKKTQVETSSVVQVIGASAS
ncbi:ATP-binding cassette domain-containing protein [Mesorhizobium calcicola]|uniref:ATP-binding cassette domain-containing protein n=1 Tax=Mesorhizobium calcicola TaxID=1300310 RepID=A0ABW4WB01_9HYPH